MSCGKSFAVGGMRYSSFRSPLQRWSSPNPFNRATSTAPLSRTNPSSRADRSAAKQATAINALGPVVTQPIEFPHYIHVEKMGIDCLYCHTYARRSAVSGIPRLDKCIGCHQSIESVKDKPRIKLLFDYWEKKQAIPWKKVHDLPDFVRFNHERHIQRFIFDQGRPTREACGYCHGDVGAMTTARRVKAISMGWCISCHEKDHKIDAVSDVTSHGPNDCWQCHK